MNVVEPLEQDESSRLREPIEEYSADAAAIGRLFPNELSKARRKRLSELRRSWLERIQRDQPHELTGNDGVDRGLFEHYLLNEDRRSEIESAAYAKLEPWLPFADGIIELDEARRKFGVMEPREAAKRLDDLAASVRKATERCASPDHAAQHEAYRSAEAVGKLRGTLKEWFEFYDGYHPAFTWWASSPYRALDEALEQYAKELKEKVVGHSSEDDGAIVGNPVGRDALIAELRSSLIGYTPEELVAIGEREAEWCEVEMKRAARELGLGDDWRKAVELVKGMHVEPGEQPKLVRDLAVEAIEFLETHDLVTVPELAKETWRMAMMPAEKQKVNPFFLGGEQIIVSYPTLGMSHAEKLMSLRGNNAHFSRATVQHELIPGHHLQFFMLQRHRPYRKLFGTPFWIEGWALYWEMLLWELGFPRGPEDRVGMLFWRMHRAVRIIFSIRFHLGQISSEECVAMLVDRVGHEPANAEGEVRRSFGGAYPPLYQAAYMVGGLQFRALSSEIVGAGRMSYRRLHDEILKQNQMPVGMLRAVLRGLPRDAESILAWRFADTA
jgi:hypothetical protein